MSCSCRKYAALLSRSAKIATRTLAPVTSVRPEDCTWIAARWITRWNAAVGTASDPSISVTRLARSLSMNSTSVVRSSSVSTLHAFRTRDASGSSTRASRRCSSVANSCRRALASARAAWIACSSVFENEGTVVLLLILDGAGCNNPWTHSLKVWSIPTSLQGFFRQTGSVFTRSHGFSVTRASETVLSRTYLREHLDRIGIAHSEMHLDVRIGGAQERIGVKFFSQGGGHRRLARAASS